MTFSRGFYYLLDPDPFQWSLTSLTGMAAQILVTERGTMLYSFSNIKGSYPAVVLCLLC